MRRWLALWTMLVLAGGGLLGLLLQAATAETAQDILPHAEKAALAATQARMLGWVAVILIAATLLVLGFVALRLAGRGWASLGDADWPLRVVHRRQVLLGKSVEELNRHFQDMEADRQQLSAVVSSINEQMAAMEQEIAAAAARKASASARKPG